MCTHTRTHTHTHTHIHTNYKPINLLKFATKEIIFSSLLSCRLRKVSTTSLLLLKSLNSHYLISYFFVFYWHSSNFLSTFHIVFLPNNPIKFLMTCLHVNLCLSVVVSICMIFCRHHYASHCVTYQSIVTCFCFGPIGYCSLYLLIFRIAS